MPSLDLLLLIGAVVALVAIFAARLGSTFGLPSLLLFSAIQAMTRSLQSVQRSDGFAEIIGEDLVCGMGDLMQLLAR